MDKPEPRWDRTIQWLDRLEWLVAILLTLAAVALHLRLFREVGGLWRDEVNSVNLASWPTISGMWRHLDYDSFPILNFLILRGWITIFGAGNDLAFRALGLIVGLAIIGALWLSGRSFGARAPILSLALLGSNPMFMRYGDSVRAYGLGILLLLLTLRSFWKLVQKPLSAGRIVVALLFALLAVQCLYYNSVLLFAVAMGAIAVAARAKEWKKVLIVLGIGMIAAVSLLPYVPMMARMRLWTFLVNYRVTLPFLFKRSCEVTGSPFLWEIGVWTGLFLFAIVIVATDRRTDASPTDNRPGPWWRRLPPEILFAFVAAVVGLMSYVAFLRTLHYFTQPWYYISMAAFAAAAFDVIYLTRSESDHSRVSGRRVGAILIGLLLLASASFKAWGEVSIRHTNVDLIAPLVNEKVQAGDVVLVPRWECAISFLRYYHGPVPVVTIPPIEDHHLHRYDLVLEQMKIFNAHQPVLDKLEIALRSGHRVFLVGGLPMSKEDLPPPTPRLVFKDEEGKWHGLDGSNLWPYYVGQFLRQHATKAEQFPLSLTGPTKVQSFEDLILDVIEGWK